MLKELLLQLLTEAYCEIASYKKWQWSKKKLLLKSILSLKMFNYVFNHGNSGVYIFFQSTVFSQK